MDSQLLQAAKHALEFIQAIDGYENSRTANELRQAIEAAQHRVQVDQLRVQLAGCLTAAEGWGQQCFAGDYGWSPAYQAVIELRKLYEKSAQQSVQRMGLWAWLKKWFGAIAHR